MFFLRGQHNTILCDEPDSSRGFTLRTVRSVMVSMPKEGVDLMDLGLAS